MSKIQKNKLFQNAVSGIKKQMQKQIQVKPKQKQQHQKLVEQIGDQPNNQWQDISSGERQKLQSLGVIKKHKMIYKDKVPNSGQHRSNINSRLASKVWQHDKYQKPKFNESLLNKINTHLSTVPSKSSNNYQQFEVKFQQKISEKILLQVLRKQKAFIRQYSQNKVVMTTQQAYKNAINAFEQKNIKIIPQKVEQQKIKQTPVQEKKKVGILERFN